MLLWHRFLCESVLLLTFLVFDPWSKHLLFFIQSLFPLLGLVFKLLFMKRVHFELRFQIKNLNLHLPLLLAQSLLLFGNLSFKVLFVDESLLPKLDLITVLQLRWLSNLSLDGDRFTALVDMVFQGEQTGHPFPFEVSTHAPSRRHLYWRPWYCAFYRSPWLPLLLRYLDQQIFRVLAETLQRIWDLKAHMGPGKVALLRSVWV